MAPILIWRCFSRKIIFDTPVRIVDLLTENKFNGEEVTSACEHVLQFIDLCIFHHITDKDVMCLLLTLTFEGRVKGWCETLPVASIRSFEHLISEFIASFAVDDFTSLSTELQNLRKNNDESVEDFINRFLHLCYMFPSKDLPWLNEWFHQLFLSNEPDLKTNQSDFSSNDYSQVDFSLHENSENIEVEENQPYMTSFFTLMDVDFKVHEVSDYDMSTSSLDDMQVYEEDCHVLKDFSSMSEMKEIQSQTPSSAEETRGSFCGNLISDHIIQSPLIPESSHSEESNDFLPYLSSYHEYSKVSDNLLDSGPSVNLVMDINQPILKEETKSPTDSSVEEELFSEGNFCNNLSRPRKEFHFLYASTYFSLYPDIFNQETMYSPCPYNFDSTLPQSSEVQYNHDLHLENKDINLSSHETSYPLSTWELGSIQTSRFEGVSYDSSQFLNQQSYPDHSLQFESQYELSKVNNYHHTNSFHLTFDADFSPSWLNSISSAQASDYEEIHPFQTVQVTNHDAVNILEIEFQIIESEFDDLFERAVCLQNDIHREKILQEGLLNLKSLSRDSVHKHLAQDCHDSSLSCPHSFEQTCFVNDIYYDRIADWLERSFLAKFPENGKAAFTLFFEDQNCKFDLFFFGFEILPFLVIILISFDFAGWELLRWLHWKFAFT